MRKFFLKIYQNIEIAAVNYYAVGLIISRCSLQRQIPITRDIIFIFMNEHYKYHLLSRRFFLISNLIVNLQNAISNTIKTKKIVIIVFKGMIQKLILTSSINSP